ncbi:hypothetical protein GIB67_024736 [Kingdonia uniflora]|uniref:PWWP domain-containing protein n=1 Tax=Kingdonia uniflora TaxID=39325 RepID=A0A7J7N9H5_9MAGN|nr:hypothetical protein GIB67_024736 [Kingdonia uniflora]
MEMEMEIMVQLRTQTPPNLYESFFSIISPKPKRFDLAGKSQMTRSGNPNSRVSSSSSIRVSSSSSAITISDGEIIEDYNSDLSLSGDSNPTLSQLFTFINQRNRNKRNKDFDDLSRVLDIRKRKRVRVLENNNKGKGVSFKNGDIVWVKPSQTWWPGWIASMTSGIGNGNVFVSVSLFGSHRTLNLHVSNIRRFEENVKCEFSAKFENALAELGQRLVLRLACPCQGSGSAIKNGERDVFRDSEVLSFVKRMAVSPWVDDTETVDAIRVGAQVNAFRRFAFIKRDWIYRETMRISESAVTRDSEPEGTSQETHFQCPPDDEVAYLGTREPKFSHEENDGTYEVFSKQVDRFPRKSKKTSLKPLCEILTHLRCLALDPFYSGSTAVSSRSLCQKFLKYRALVYQNVPNQVLIDEVPNLYHEIEFQINDGNHNSNVSTENNEKKSVEENSEAKIDFSTQLEGLSNDELLANYAAFLKEDTRCYDNEAEIHKIKEMHRADIVSHPGTASVETLHGDNSNTEYHESYGSKFFADVVLEKSVNGRSVDTQVDCELRCYPSGDIQGSKCDVGVAVKKSPLLSRLSDHPSKADSANDVTYRVSLGKVSEVISDQPVPQGFPIKFQKDHCVCPRNLEYSSSYSSVNTDSNSGNPTTLHMKFPKDFKLPSKEELVKQFRPFGPLNYAKTRVFSYTGSAQVCFLNQLDTEAAYHVAKIKKKFFGRANVIYWLDRYEHSRKGTTSNVSVPAPVSSLKSCLRPSNPERTVKRKSNHVKFLQGNQVISLPAKTRTKDGDLTVNGDLYECGREVAAPDISRQMLMLLEKCSHIVCRMKENLGLESYYSLFSYS